MLIQERYRNEPWKLLVACVLLNITSRQQVDKVIDELFERFPNPVRMEAATDEEIGEIIRPCGLWRRRAGTLRRLSGQWSRIKLGWPFEDPPEQEVCRIHGVGLYALDSYRFFVLGDTSRFESGDKELAKWLLEDDVALD